MHRVVEVIPLLLHGSLALFFAGLVAFLIPVNNVLTVITALILLVVGGLYIVFTLLPLQWLDCPYHTPLSATAWIVWHALQRTWLTRCHPANPTPANSQSRSKLIKKFPDRVHSSPAPVSAETWLTRCRAWLPRLHRVRRKDVESATHPDPPTESVRTPPTPVSATPAPTPGPTAPAQADSSVGSLPPHPHHVTMMKAMLHAAADHSEGRKEREYKALVWTMGSLADNSELEPFIQGIADVLEEPHEQRPAYEEHIRCLILEPNTHLLDRITNLLDSCTTTLLSPEAIQRRRITCYRALWVIASLLTKSGEAMDFEYIYTRPSFRSEEHYRISARAMMAHSTLIAVEPQILQWSDSLWRRISAKFCSSGYNFWTTFTPAGPADALASISSNIYLEFVTTATCLKSPPYQWVETRITLTGSHKVQGIDPDDLLDALDRAVFTPREPGDDMAWFNKIVPKLLSFWPPTLRRIPESVVRFLQCRPYESMLPKHVAVRLWRCLPRTLSEGVFGTRRGHSSQEELLTAMWCAAASDWWAKSDPSALSILQAALEALCNTDFSPAEAQISQSLVVVLKVQIIYMIGIQNFSTVGEALRSLEANLFPADTAVYIPAEIRDHGEDEDFEKDPIWIDFLKDKRSEAIFYAVVEYLERCASSTPPYNAAKTLEKITVYTPRKIHPAHQARLAESVGMIFETEQAVELVNVVIDLHWWTLYADGHKNEEELEVERKYRGRVPWLQDPRARQMIKDAFGKYEGSSKAKAKKLVEGLEFWHPEETGEEGLADTPVL
ncbi:hypothetical protein C8R46DRAFT_999577 [Mycena filopes]|nr:hypothetical protein C8R46DRAFT_999577 [Mycena filopes]